MRNHEPETYRECNHCGESCRPVNISGSGSGKYVICPDCLQKRMLASTFKWDQSVTGFTVRTVDDIQDNSHITVHIDPPKHSEPKP